MSVINLHCDEICWGEVLPNISLVQATSIVDSPYIGDNGVEMTEGRFGLTRSNDPFIVFSQTPKSIITDQQVWDNMEAIDKWDNELIGSIYDMHPLYESCRKAGYHDGNLGLWICNHIFQFLQEKNPIETYPSIAKLSGRVQL